MISIEQDHVVEGRVASLVTDEPTDTQVLAALAALDGRERTQVWLYRGAHTRLLVSGPVQGRYAIDFSGPDDYYYAYAIDPEQADGGDVPVPAGNDVVAVPFASLIEATHAREVLVHFFSTGALSSVVHWVRG